MTDNFSKSIDEFIRKNSKYDYYFDDRLDHKPKSVNCYDEICPGSHERGEKIRLLLGTKVKAGEDFIKDWSALIHELHDLMRDEHMAMTDCTEMEANYWLDAFVDFNHVKHQVIDGELYLSPDPVIGYKYGDENAAENIDKSTKKS